MPRIPEPGLRAPRRIVGNLQGFVDGPISRDRMTLIGRLARSTQHRSTLATESVSAGPFRASPTLPSPGDASAVGNVYDFTNVTPYAARRRHLFYALDDSRRRIARASYGNVRIASCQSMPPLRVANPVSTHVLLQKNTRVDKNGNQVADLKENRFRGRRQGRRTSTSRNPWSRSRRAKIGSTARR